MAAISRGQRHSGWSPFLQCGLPQSMSVWSVNGFRAALSNWTLYVHHQAGLPALFPSVWIQWHLHHHYMAQGYAALDRSPYMHISDQTHSPVVIPFTSFLQGTNDTMHSHKIWSWWLWGTRKVIFPTSTVWSHPRGHVGFHIIYYGILYITSILATSYGMLNMSYRYYKWQCMMTASGL